MKRIQVLLGFALLASTFLIPLSSEGAGGAGTTTTVKPTTTTAPTSFTTPTQTLNVPKSPWPVCSENFVTWCISSVSIQSPGEKAAEVLTWVPSGTPAPGTTTTTTAAPTTTTTAAPTTTTTSATPTPTTTTTTVAPKTKIGTATYGFWTNATWTQYGHAVAGYGGLYVQAQAANVFSNYMMFSVLPAMQDGTGNATYVANQPGNNYAASLNPSDIITVSLKTGVAQTGVTMAIANNFSAVTGTDANGTTYSFTASPVPVPIASATSSCTGETGVAAAVANQLQVIVAPVNDPTSGFGVDGVSGKMYVESNGACSLSTPVWDATAKQFSWTAGAPHFADDGKTVNLGFFQALIPGADAGILWGLTNINDAATALVISETSGGDTSNVTSVSSISVKNGNIIISYTGFQYSKPKFTISKNPKYKFSAPTKVLTITCANIKNPKLKKVVKAIKPVCPSGYKKV